MHFEDADEKVTFYIEPHPQPVTPLRAQWATLGTVMNNFYSSPKMVSTTLKKNLTVLLLDPEKTMFEIYIVLALWDPPPGPPLYHLNNFKSLAPKDDSCKVWLKSDCVFKKMMKVTVYIEPPNPFPPPPPPPSGAQWGHPGNCHEQPSFFTKEGIFTLKNLTVLLLDL